MSLWGYLYLDFGFPVSVLVYFLLAFLSLKFFIVDESWGFLGSGFWIPSVCSSTLMLAFLNL